MTKILKTLLAVAVVVAGSFGAAGIAQADVSDSSGNNVQEGNNRSTGRQAGRSSSGDAVGGQVTGVVSSGRTSVDASNRSENVDVTSGDAEGSNNAATFTGLNDTSTDTAVREVPAADIDDVAFANNLQEGDNRSSLSQSATATTGDGVGGQVIGVVTAAGGSASVVAANTSRDSSIETGDAETNNDALGFTGLNFLDFEDDFNGGAPLASDITDSCFAGCGNVQEGDNATRGSQSARAATGDGVGGQVLGVVSAGATSLDASNLTQDSFVDTGDADSNNDVADFAGLNFAPEFEDGLNGNASDIDNVPFAANLQEGDNRRSFSQSADATSGDAVAGQVAGVVTSAGGSASVVLANTSTGIDAETGEGEFDNFDEGFTGLNFGALPTFVGAPTNGTVL